MERFKEHNKNKIQSKIYQKLVEYILFVIIGSAMIIFVPCFIVSNEIKNSKISELENEIEQIKNERINSENIIENFEKDKGSLIDLIELHKNENKIISLENIKLNQEINYKMDKKRK
jgi:hypothetical protein